MQDAVLIKVKNLSRQYGQICAVDNVSFEAKRGEVLGFLGPNGAGKSTTMQMLTGNLAPSHGQILINDIDLLEQPKLAKAEIGYLPEQPPIYRDLTVDEYLSYCAKLHGIEKTKLISSRDKAKQRCGLTEVGHRLIGHLSKGYQQRVGLAQATIHLPPIIILDEPTVGLDPLQIREIRQMIRDLGQQHCVILSTHILSEVQAVCDKVQIINQGRLVLKESIAELNLQQHICLRVEFQASPSISEFETIPDIISSEQINANEFLFTCESHPSVATHITKLAVQHNWGLLQMTPQQRNLEELFVDIVSGKESSQSSFDNSTQSSSHSASHNTPQSNAINVSDGESG